MRYHEEIQPETFRFDSQAGDAELIEMEELSGFSAESAEQEWEEEVKRGSPEYTAWVQHSLNQIAQLRLAADGVVGPATRSAIRSFQQQTGLSVDGVVGPQTEQKIIQALRRLLTSGPQSVCARMKQPDVLDRFDFDSDKVKPHHQPQMSQLAQCIVAMASARQPIPPIRLVGHTDPVGSEAYNLALGRRRAEQVRRSLQDNIDRLSPGLSGRISFIAETRGEAQPIPGDALRSRRVEIFVPIKPPPQKGCPPFKARIRLHAKILQAPDIPVSTMIASMRQVYGPAGFLVDLVSTEHLNLPELVDLDVGPCTQGTVTNEQRQLFAQRNRVGNNDVVAYFVRSTNPPFNGCAAHPAGRPGAVVAQGATEWTLAHEIGHVLDLSHVNNNDRLMTGNGTANITNPPPDLIGSEIKTMDNSPLTIDC